MSKKNNETLKETFSKTASKAGSKSLAAIAIVLAAVIAVNVLVTLLPEKFTTFDLTKNNLFEITDTSKKLVSALKDDVTIYSVCTEGNEEKSIGLLLNSYEAASKHITVKKVDQSKDLTFASKFGDAELDDNSVVVESGKRYRVITSEDLFELQINYSTYQYQATGLSAEDAITNAIDYVTGAEVTKIGFLTGHSEICLDDLDADFTKALSLANYEFSEFSIIAEGKIPDGLGCVAITSPQKDFSKDDVKALTDYMKKGGKIVLCTDLVTEDKFPVLSAFLKGYGITLVDGVIFEADQTRCTQSYAYVLPFIQSHAVTNGLDDMYVLFPGTQGFTVAEDAGESLLVEPLLNTSEGAFSVVNYEGKTVPEYQKENGDIKVDGGFTLGAAITETATDNDTVGKMVYFSTSSFINGQANEMVHGANSSLFVNAFNWLCDRKNAVSIPSKSLLPDTLLISDAAAGILTFVFVILIPAAVLIAGIVILIIRKKR